MRRPAETVPPTASVMLAANRMRETDVGTLVVVDEAGAPLGIVTDRDIAVRVCAFDRRASDVAVGTIMTSDPVVCHEEKIVSHAESLMTKHRKSRLVIVDAKGRATGILSLSDLVAYERPLRLARVLYAIAARRFAVERP